MAALYTMSSGVDGSAGSFRACQLDASRCTICRHSSQLYELRAQLQEMREYVEAVSLLFDTAAKVLLLARRLSTVKRPRIHAWPGIVLHSWHTFRSHEVSSGCCIYLRRRTPLEAQVGFQLRKVTPSLLTPTRPHSHCTAALRMRDELSFTRHHANHLHISFSLCACSEKRNRHPRHDIQPDALARLD